MKSIARVPYKSPQISYRVGESHLHNLSSGTHRDYESTGASDSPPQFILQHSNDFEPMGASNSPPQYILPHSQGLRTNGGIWFTSTIYPSALTGTANPRWQLTISTIYPPTLTRATNRHDQRQNVEVSYLVNWCFEPSQHLRIISGLKETFIKRHVVERTNKAEIRPEEQSEKTESSRENW